jgi:ATP-binding cassette subfamily F protein 3
VVQKEHNLEILQSAYELQQKELKRKQATVERFKAKASKAKMAQSMMKAIDRIERIVIPPGPRKVAIQFPPTDASGKTVLTVRNIGQSFGTKKIFEGADFAIERGQKVALIAPNGVGKTTLFNIITKALPIQHGSLEFGYNVKYSIFAQDQNKELDPKKSILDNIQQRCPRATEQQVRSILGAFLFSGEDVQKKVGVLSGGEKNRVGMICVLLAQANFLLLDEPTNHLDIPSKEVLLKALQTFTGTLFFVSHDRDFINDLATHIIELTQTGTHFYHGNYEAYLYHKNAISGSQITGSQSPSDNHKAAATEKTEEKLTGFELAKKIKRVEGSIAKVESLILAVQEEFGDLEWGTPEFGAAEQRLQKLQKELKEQQQLWESLQGKVYEA